MRSTIFVILLLLGSPLLALDFNRGDCNSDTAIDVGDAIYLLDHLFGGAEDPSCMDSCDSNDDGILDLGDAITLLSLLFDPSVTSLPAPYPDAGPDLTADGLTCGDPSLDDQDGDGFTIADGDCCDTSALINPGAYDIPGNGIDEDCSGTPDDEDVACDGLVGGELTALDLVASLNLCKVATSDSDWGLLTATLERADGTPFVGTSQAEAVTSFGPSILPQEGSTFVALSTGVVATPLDPDFVDPAPGTHHAVDGSPPASFLAAHGGTLPDLPSPCGGLCSGGVGANDSVCLHLTLRVPTNAVSFSFDWYFLSSEFAVWTCTSFNDYALALLQSGAPETPADGNIMHDGDGNPITVNSALMEVCDPKPCYPCPQGSSQLEDTGYEDSGGGTGWLTSTAPVVPGEVIDLRIMVWDTSDNTYDTMLMIDRFQWNLEEPLGPCL